MKIKTKKQMTLEEYAKYMIDKFGIANYERKLIDNNIFDAPMELEQTFTLKPMRKDDNPVIEYGFKGVVIEVEETVTEDTVIPKMLVIGRFDGYEEVYNQKLSSFNQHLLSAYLIHDDGHMELIYDEVKGLVE